MVVTEEIIVVVPRETLFLSQKSWNGIIPRNSAFINVITTEWTLCPRSKAELDESYKQIIPYIIFFHDNKYFFMQRDNKGNTKELAKKCTLGIGGHIRREDVIDDSTATNTPLELWGMREFSEEVSYNGTFTIEVIGFINDDRHALGRVHLGVILLMRGTSSDIAVKTEMAWGSLLTLNECYHHYALMDSWTKYTVAALKENEKNNRFFS